MNSFVAKMFFLGWAFGQISAHITSTPSGALVSINGNSIGTTPINDYRLGTGKQTFELKLDGYAPAAKTMDIQSAKSVRLAFHLKKLYHITFKTDEKGVMFVFNKIDSVKGGKNDLVMEEGEHHFQALRNERVIDEKIIIIDRHKTIEYKLKKQTRKSAESSE